VKQRGAAASQRGAPPPPPLFRQPQSHSSLYKVAPRSTAPNTLPHSHSSLGVVVQPRLLYRHQQLPQVGVQHASRPGEPLARPRARASSACIAAAAAAAARVARGSRRRGRGHGQLAQGLVRDRGGSRTATVAQDACVYGVDSGEGGFGQSMPVFCALLRDASPCGVLELVEGTAAGKGGTQQWRLLTPRAWLGIHLAA
jgi:hypothetical protein